jgi:EmrB/QacA subfamily drug resistance transporter
VPALLALACAVATFALSQSMLNPALPTIQHQTGASPAATTWLVTVYFLVASVAAPVFGRLGDMLGRRTWLAVAMGAFAMGGLVAAVGAEYASLPVMIAGRALQGLSGGVFPLALAIARSTIPRVRLPFAVSVPSSTTAIGAAVGVAAGGVVVDLWGYHAIFWASAVCGSAVVVLVLVGLGSATGRRPGRVDVLGATLLSVGVGAFLLTFSEAPRWGWQAPGLWVLAGTALLVLPLWARHERRHASPLVDLALARTPALLRTNVATLLTGIGLFGSLVLTPQLVQRPASAGGVGLTAAQAGLIVMPTALVNFLSSPLVGITTRRFGPKIPMVFGCVVAAGCLLLLATAHDSVHIIAVWTALLGLGTGCVFASTSSLVLEAVDAAEAGQATGVNTIARSIGSSIGTQIGGVLLAGNVVSAAGPSSERGFLIAFVMGAATSLVAGLVALTIPGRQASTTAPLAVAPTSNQR